MQYQITICNIFISGVVSQGGNLKPAQATSSPIKAVSFPAILLGLEHGLLNIIHNLITITTPFNPNRALEPVQILCVVEHIVCLILEGIVDYVKRKRQARCRQANERWTGNNENNLKFYLFLSVQLAFTTTLSFQLSAQSHFFIPIMCFQPLSQWTG